MRYSGSCRCKRWRIDLSIAGTLETLNPRVCDCGYCQTHPSALTSVPDMRIELSGDSGNLSISKQGDRLADFFECKACGQLLAVGCEIDGRLRGAANGLLLDERALLGPPTPIQPRLLSAEEKVRRWDKLWGTLTVRASDPTS